MSVPRSDISTFIAAWNRAVAELNRRLSDLTEPGTDSNAPDEALGRCPAMIQCHRETGHEGGHEARGPQ